MTAAHKFPMPTVSSDLTTSAPRMHDALHGPFSGVLISLSV